MRIEKYQFRPLNVPTKERLSKDDVFAILRGNKIIEEYVSEKVEEIVEEMVTEAAEPAPTVQLYTEEQLTEQKEKGYQEGYQKACDMYDLENVTIQQNIHSCLLTMKEQLTGIKESLQEAQDKNIACSVQIAKLVATKLIEPIIEERHLELVAHLVEQIITDLVHETSINLYTHPNIENKIKKYLLDTYPHLYDKIHVFSDKNLAPGDCRVDMQSGGCERSLAELNKKIDDIIATHIPTSH